MTTNSENDLDRQVAEALGYKNIDGVLFKTDGNNIGSDSYVCATSKFTPSTNWQQAGELLEKFNICVRYALTSPRIQEDEIWVAYGFDCNDNQIVRESTPQRAICKAVIALKES